MWRGSGGNCTPLSLKVQQHQTEDDRCPDTHECFAGFAGAQYCCPRPCPNLPKGHTGVLVNSKCYERASLSAACQLAEQCPLNAVCASQQCVCRDGYIRQWTHDGVEMCAKRCTGSEVAIGGDCLPIALPASPCTHDEQCAIGGTRCRQGTCQCPCNQAMLSGKCVTMPLCAPTTMPPLVDTAGSLYDCLPATAELLYNSCAQLNGYCMPLVGSRWGGLCCPLPGCTLCEPFNHSYADKQCLANATPQMAAGKIVDCSLRAKGGCESNHYCHDYASVALGPMTPTGMTTGICCPNTPAINSFHGLFPDQPRLYGKRR